MKQKIITIILIILLIISLMVIVGLALKLNEKNHTEKDIFETQSTLKENSSHEDIHDFEPSEQSDEKELIDNDEETNNPGNQNSEIIYSDNDKAVINTLEETELSLDEEMNSDDESIADKAKGVFITLVDFIFYEGEIGGVTFNELTDAGKEKVLAIVNSIDEKIEKRFPKYKENISGTTSSAFVKASEIIKTGSQNIKDFSREKLGEENYNALSAAKDELVYYTKKGVSIISEKSGNIYNKVKDKVKNWYENFRDKN